MSHQVALTFEDGVTRFITCGDDETVADASYKARINIPLDCRDGACGTCKAFCESGEWDQGDYIEDALTDEELEQRWCLPCQMTPLSDLVVQIQATSDVAKTAAATYDGTIASIERTGDMVSFEVEVANRDQLAYLPGQYMNILVPGTDQTRSYSFSSAPDDTTLSFLIKIVPGGLMSGWLENAKIGDKLQLTGPFGSFFLRELKRPTLFLAGGSGLAPLLAMGRRMRNGAGATQPVHLILGINVDDDLVHADELDALAAEMPDFTWEYVVADQGSAHTNKGYVTTLMDDERMREGDLDVYLCGPPPMVEAVREHFKAKDLNPVSFYFEKFTNAASAAKPGDTPPVAGPATVSELDPAAEAAAAADQAVETQVYEIGEEHPSVLESDAIFDARMGLELAVMELTIGRMTPAQVNGFARVATNSDVGIDGDRFTDAAAFVDANAVFHEYPFLQQGNDHLLEAFRRLGVAGHMADVLAKATYCHPGIVKEHHAIVEAFELGDRDKARELIRLHAEHSKTTMHKAMSEAGVGRDDVKA